MDTAVILEGARTPVGKFLGSFAGTTAVELGTIAAVEALRRAEVEATAVDQTIFGHARQAGNGPNTGRQVSIHAGVPQEISAYNVNIACGSGMKAAQLGAQQIMLGQSEVALVGGMENMTRVPYLLPDMRLGYSARQQRGRGRDVPRRSPRSAVRPDHGRDRREPRRHVRHLPRGAGRLRARVPAEGGRRRGRARRRDVPGRGAGREADSHGGRGRARATADHDGLASQARAGLPRRRVGHGRKLQRSHRRRGIDGADGRGSSDGRGPRATRDDHRDELGRRRPHDHGDRPGARDEEGARVRPGSRSPTST